MTIKPLAATLLATALLAPGLALAATNQELTIENLRQADANGDRELTLEEFTTFIDLNAADGLGRAAELKASGHYPQVFQYLDSDGNGLLSADEFRRPNAGN